MAAALWQGRVQISWQQRSRKARTVFRSATKLPSSSLCVTAIFQRGMRFTSTRGIPRVASLSEGALREPRASCRAMVSSFFILLSYSFSFAAAFAFPFVCFLCLSWFDQLFGAQPVEPDKANTLMLQGALCAVRLGQDHGIRGKFRGGSNCEQAVYGARLIKQILRRR